MQHSLPSPLGRPSHPYHHPPLTTVALVCASRDGLTTLAPPVSAFIDPALPGSKRWTIERACKFGFLHLLQRLVDADAAAHQIALYRSHVFSHALPLALVHENVLALLACLRAYCPDGDTDTSFCDWSTNPSADVLRWLIKHGLKAPDEPNIEGPC